MHDYIALELLRARRRGLDAGIRRRALQQAFSDDAVAPRRPPRPQLLTVESMRPCISRSR